MSLSPHRFNWCLVGSDIFRHLTCAMGPPMPMQHPTEQSKDVARATMRNFIQMSIYFSANHGTVTSLIALASSSLGRELGNASSATLYFVYFLTAGFLSNYATAAFGAKKTIVAGLTIYCAYVVSYLVAYLAPGSAWIAVLVGAVLGGFAAGILWPAQGWMYAESADRYAKATGVTREAANSLFGGYFSATYMGLEVTMKLCSSIIPMLVGDDDGIVVLFIFFSVVAATSALLSTTIDPLIPVVSDDRCPKRVFELVKRHGTGRGPVPEDDDDDDIEDDDATPTKAPPPDFGDKALAAVRLLVRDPKCLCMVPMNFVFGLGSSYVNGYFDGVVVSGEMGVEEVGFVSAVVVGSATLLALVYGHIGRRFKGDQAPIVIFGACCISAFAAVNLAFSPSQVGSWTVAVPLAMLFGSGRAIWEGNFKASFADYFPNDLDAAFANVILQSGLASTVGFFLIFAAPFSVIGGLVILAGALAVISQLVARRLHFEDNAKTIDHFAYVTVDTASIPGDESSENGMGLRRGDDKRHDDACGEHQRDLV